METKEVINYELRESIKNMDGAPGHRNPDHIDYLQISLPVVMADVATRLNDCRKKERQKVAPFVWQGALSAYKNPAVIDMLLDISAAIDELINSHIINIQDND